MAGNRSGVHCCWPLHAALSARAQSEQPRAWTIRTGAATASRTAACVQRRRDAQPGVRQLCGDLLQNMLRPKVMLNAHRANPTLAYDGLTKE
jgi:hypothetical protein